MSPPRDATPDRLEPMLARAGELPRNEEGWSFEVKWDGLRTLVEVADGAARVRTRTGREVTAGYPELAGLADALDGRDAVLDGEVVAFADGRPSFQALQPRMSSHAAAPTRGLREGTPVVLMLFDLLRLDGEDLLDVPYDERRARLEALELDGEAWRTPAAHPGQGRALLEQTAERGLEGVIAKRRDSRYRPGHRADAWVKVKNERRQEFVIGGYTPGDGGRRDTFGSLQVGVHDADGALRHAGGVGSGFSEAVLRDLTRRLRAIERRTSPFAGRQPPGDTVFVTPRLVCEVRFAEWTGEGSIRQSSFRGLREDKPAAEVVREGPAAAPDERSTAPPDLEIPAEGDHVLDVEGREVKVTNLDKVLWPGVPWTKGEMIAWYARISPVLLPHLRDRPVTLVRFPNGVEGKSFYAKRAPRGTPEWVRTTRVGSATGRDAIDYPVLDDLPTLLWAANLAGVELHPFLHLAPAPERPRSVVFDLDPGPGTSVVECCALALEIRALLAELGLRGLAKTSGSKGLQLHVPTDEHATYEATSTFAHAVAALLERRRPEGVVSAMAKSRREGRVFVDWSQNNPKKTTIGVYSLRARGRPTVSTPVTWEEVEACAGGGDPEALVFDAPAVLARVAEHGDLQAEVLGLEQELPELSG